MPYADLVFTDLDWSEIYDHDPGHRAERKGTTEHDIPTEWATEACQDPRRVVRSANSRSGLTVKVTGWSDSARLLVTVVVAAKDRPEDEQWWGATAWKANARERREYGKR